MSSPSRRTPRKFLALLISLVALFVLFPFAHKMTIGGLLTDMVGSVILLAVIRAVHQHTGQLVVAVIVAVPTIAVNWLNDFIVTPPMIIGGAALYAIFFAYTVVVVLSHVVTADQVTGDKVFGASCAYLLIGMVWGNVYFCVEQLAPHSFRVMDSALDYAMATRAIDNPESLYYYFSFTTLTTVGYGDVLPVSPVARNLAMLEAIVGQLYLTVLIARLVGLHIAHSMMRQGPGASG